MKPPMKPYVRIQDMPAKTEEEINKKNSLLDRARVLGLARNSTTKQDVLDAETKARNIHEQPQQ